MMLNAMPRSAKSSGQQPARDPAHGEPHTKTKTRAIHGAIIIIGGTRTVRGTIRSEGTRFSILADDFGRMRGFGSFDAWSPCSVCSVSFSFSCVYARVSSSAPKNHYGERDGDMRGRETERILRKRLLWRVYKMMSQLFFAAVNNRRIRSDVKIKF